MYEWFCKWLEPAVLIQILIAGGLVFYALDTRRLRKASQEQNELMQKPCLVPVLQERKHIVGPAWDAEIGIKYPDHRSIAFSHVELKNIGDGAAFNIQYEIQKREPRSLSKGSLLYIEKGHKASTRLMVDDFETSSEQEDVSLKLSYESLSGRRYENVMSTRQLGEEEKETLVTKCQFGVTTSRTPWRVKICQWLCRWICVQ